MIKKNCLFILLFLSSVLALAQSSVLSSGPWYKFSVAADGIYKIDYQLLQKAGINPSQINPQNIKIFAGQRGMLPQPNSTPRLADLQEMAITVVGEADGKFDAADVILFYGQSPDNFYFDQKAETFYYQNNLFTDKNFYFLTVSTSAGKRNTVNENTAGSYPVINQYDEFGYYESDKYNLLHSGRHWFGEQFDETLQFPIQFNVPGIVPNSSITLISHVMAESITDCSFDVSYNTTKVVNQKLGAIPNVPYGITGTTKADTVVFNESMVNGSSQNTQTINYQFNKGGPGISIGYLDYLIFNFKRTLALYNAQTIFTSSESTTNAISTFQINSVSSGNLVWDITDEFNSQTQSGQLNGSSFSFSCSTQLLKKFVVFDPEKISLANFESTVVNQNLHSITNADLVIISHPTFFDQASRLAAYRQSHNQLMVATVTTDAVYNEYSGGKPDFTALRDFVRDVYKKSNGQLKHVLLFGRGSYDYKNRVYANTNFVPIYESYESLDPLGSYSSDDYYGFLEDNEGAWGENPAVNYSMDVAVGRLPVKSLDEAKTVVDKLIDYDTNPDRFGPWRKEFLFVADDGDNNLHESESDQLANSVLQNHPEFEATKFFLSNFKQIMKPIGQFSPEATKALDLEIRKGKFLVNYTGHGNETLWAQEEMMTPELIQSLSNGPRYPLFVNATCEFGRNDDPFIISSAELLLLQKNGGGIGLVTTSRLVNSYTNFQLNQAFYQALFLKANAIYRPLGAVMRDTKNNSTSGVSNRNFSLLGDPSMTLALANDQVVATQIQTVSGSDTLKALSQISIKGEVQHNGIINSSFNGVVDATLFDKNQNLVTLGDPNETVTPPSPPYPYTARTNRLFQGSASAQQGAFQISFTMPDDLVAGIASGKLSLYAYTTNGNEAIGFNTGFMVGGVEKNPQADTAPPLIKLYVSDTTFVNGGTVSSNTKLVALLSDASGINVTTTDSQNAIIATLDNKWSYTLSSYYAADLNNPQKGNLTFPLDTLKKGLHSLTLAASDNYNNRTSQKIDFNVVQGAGVVVSEFGNYPNPFSSETETSFYFSHTRAGEDLEATISITDLTGKPVTSLHYSIASSDYRVELGKWNAAYPDGTKILPGVYVARLSVRSVADGSENSKATKLIILN